MENKITVDGVDYPLADLDSGLIEKLELWVRSQAWKELQSMRGEMDPETYDKAMGHLTKAMAGKYFRVGGEGFKNAEESSEGQYYKIFLLASAKTPALTWETVQEWRKNDMNKAMKNGQ